MSEPFAEKDAHLKVLAAAVCSSDACPVNHKPGQFCFRGWDAARAVTRVTSPADTRPTPPTGERP
jgi:hypothetical protein